MIYPRYAIKVAYDTAMMLYPTHQAAVEAVARELCIPVEQVEDALVSVMMQ